jgi:hypothetical protein
VVPRWALGFGFLAALPSTLPLQSAPAPAPAPAPSVHCTALLGLAAPHAIVFLFLLQQRSQRLGYYRSTSFTTRNCSLQELKAESDTRAEPTEEGTRDGMTAATPPLCTAARARCSSACTFLALLLCFQLLHTSHAFKVRT